MPLRGRQQGVVVEHDLCSQDARVRILWQLLLRPLQPFLPDLCVSVLTCKIGI